jgi:hypothetical protein
MRDTFGTQAATGMQRPRASGGGLNSSGMFGSYAGFKPSTNPIDFAQSSYDMSGIQQGSQMLGENRINIAQHNPYQYSQPMFDNIGGYGRSSPGEIQGVYDQAMRTGLKPVMSQSKERMRQMGQGFGGGGVSSGARGQLALRNSQQTGADVQNLSGQISSQLADRSLGQAEKERDADYQTRNTIFNATRDQQKNQASENFQSAGFNADAATRMASDATTRAQSMLQYGMQLPQLQMALNKEGMAPFGQMMDYLMKGSMTEVNPGEQYGGGK